jgi:hypothetical protein
MHVGILCRASETDFLCLQSVSLAASTIFTSRERAILPRRWAVENPETQSNCPGVA